MPYQIRLQTHSKVAVKAAKAASPSTGSVWAEMHAAMPREPAVAHAQLAESGVVLSKVQNSAMIALRRGQLWKKIRA